MKISGVVLAKDEEKNIKECIELLSFCSEILVIDDNSSDGTVKIAKKLGARVLTRKMNKNFSSQLNFGSKKAKNKWVLIVDADERVSKELAKEIKEIREESGVNGYFIKRKEFFLGKVLKFGDVKNFKDIRLFRKGAGEWGRRVHPKIKLFGRTKTLKSPLEHFSHKSLNSFLSSINRWSTWHALANFEEGKRSSIFRVVFFPFFKFIKNYVIRWGFLDGLTGFVHAVLMSFHSFLSWSKLWFYQRGKN